MTEIKIKQLRLENFKCHRHLVLNFNGGNASIYGDNASGKTSIYDALTWLLFSKDSQGNGEKNIEVKPLNALGEVADHDALTEVEAILLVNGEELSLRRTLREVWTSKRGSSEKTFDGNTSEYYVDGVPYKAKVFQAKVGEIVSEDTFRMLTSVSHFAAGITWQTRRAELFKVAGVLEDSQIMATDARFQSLADSLGRLTLDDYRKKLQAEKKNATGTKTSIPARISECQKTIDDIAGIDFAGTKEKAEALRGQIQSLSGQIIALESADNIRKAEMDLREAQLERTALDNENNAHRARQQAGMPNIPRLKNDLAFLESQRTGKLVTIEREKGYIAGLDKLIDAARANWISKNGESFKGGTCRTCGQTLPAEALAKAQAQFEADKQKRLKELEATAAQHKGSKAAAVQRIEDMEKDIARLDVDIAAKRQEIANAKADSVPVQNMPDYQVRRQALDTKVLNCSTALMDLRTSAASVTGVLQGQKADAERELADLMATVSKESLLEYSRKRIEELKNDAQSAAAILDSIEQMLFLMDEFTRYKTRFVEDSINGMFRIARFRLFREQANGGIEDRCDVVHEGVPYMNVNNGMKINLGIDIINTLSAAYGVKVPLFIDNAESVTHLEHCGSQIIRLVVSESDKELRINYGT